jgi:hypothetical protein
MAKVRIIEYEGSDEQIRKLLSQGFSRNASASSSSEESEENNRAKNASVWDAVAIKFRKEIEDALAYGYSAQKKAMVAWLQNGGEIDLPSLWKASGVKAQRDFGGVGGSLTKNMIKAGGPREWYRKHRNGKGVRQYQIVEELVGPLKREFGQK